MVISLTMIEQAIVSIGEAAAMQMRGNPDTYQQDGITYCSKCHTPLQAWVKGPTDASGDRRMVLMPVRCNCMVEAARLAEERARQADFERTMRDFRRTIGMSDCKHTFDTDNRNRPNVSSLCRKYVAQWGKMRDENLGILFYGAKGTGKSYYAECIVNALAERGIMTGFTTTAELIRRMQGTDDKDDLIDAIRAFSLLVIDDLGAERETSFAAESMYNIVNTRYRAGRPTIITTNMDLTDMRNERDIGRGRIYDRVIEMCPIAIEMKGESQRTEISDQRKQMARDFLK